MVGELGDSSTDRVVHRRLREIAARLASDHELQKDLVQEMYLHLFQVQSNTPGKTQNWYVKSCEFHARNYLRLGRSIDSHKRARNRISLDEQREEGDGVFFSEAHFPFGVGHLVAASQVDVANTDVFQMIFPRLSPSQRQIVSLLAQGFGVREIARRMGVSHPAVCKHRKKIAHIAREFLQQSAGRSCAVGVDWRPLDKTRPSFA